MPWRNERRDYSRSFKKRVGGVGDTGPNPSKVKTQVPQPELSSDSCDRKVCSPIGNDGEIATQDHSGGAVNSETDDRVKSGSITNLETTISKPSDNLSRQPSSESKDQRSRTDHRSEPFGTTKQVAERKLETADQSPSVDLRSVDTHEKDKVSDKQIEPSTELHRSEGRNMDRISDNVSSKSPLADTISPREPKLGHDKQTDLIHGLDNAKADAVILPLNKVDKDNRQIPATCRTMITVHGVGVQALIDTGAWCTMLDYPAFRRIHSHHELELTKTNRKFHGATGTSMKLYGEVKEVPIMLGGHVFHTNVIVCDVTGSEVLLGMDFLQRHSAIVDIGRSTITLRGITSLVRDNQYSEQCYAVVSDNITIRSGQITEVAIRHHWKPRETIGVFEPLVSLGDHILISPQLIHPSGDCSSICVENRSDMVITVLENQILGQVNQIDRAANAHHKAAYAVYEARTLYSEKPPELVDGTSRKQRLHITRSGFGLVRELSESDEKPDEFRYGQTTDGSVWDNQYLESLGAYALNVSKQATCVKTGEQLIPDLDIEIEAKSGCPSENSTRSRREDQSMHTTTAVGRIGHGKSSVGSRTCQSSPIDGALEETEAEVWQTMALKQRGKSEKQSRSADSREGSEGVLDEFEALPDHLRCMMPAPESLTLSQARDLVSLVNRYSDVFVGPDGKVGFTDLTTHVIDTGTEQPCKLPPRRTGFAEKKVIEDTITELLADGKIQPSISAWASPIVLVRKKDGSMRFCIDYRRLNDKTHKDAYPLPKIDEALDQLAGSCYWSCLDLASGYWQVAMHPDSVEQTAFCTHMGLFEWLVMPFGLCNAPAVFERLMDKVLQGLQWHDILVYLDDIMAFGKTYERALERLQCVFERLRLANLKLKPKKCFLLAQEVDYLGHHISRDGVAPLASKVTAITHWKEPENLEELRSFLGLACYYRRFVDDYSGIAKPLTELLKKDVRYDWTPLRQKAFDDLRRALVTAPCLAFPKADCRFMLDTDASDMAIGGVLSQIQDGGERVIAYYSRTLNSTQQRYCTTKRELLAIKACIENWEHFLRLEEFGLRTDHQALKWMSTMKCNDGAMLRWASYVNEFDFILEHRPGKLHSNADALSRVVFRKCGLEQCKECIRHSPYVERDDDNELKAVFAITRSRTKSPQSSGKSRDSRQGGKGKLVMPEDSCQAKAKNNPTAASRIKRQPDRLAKRTSHTSKRSASSRGSEIAKKPQLDTHTEGYNLRSRDRRVSERSDALVRASDANGCENHPTGSLNHPRRNPSRRAKTQSRDTAIKRADAVDQTEMPSRSDQPIDRTDLGPSVKPSQSADKSSCQADTSETSEHVRRRTRGRPSKHQRKRLAAKKADRLSQNDDLTTEIHGDAAESPHLGEGTFVELDHMSISDWSKEQKQDPVIKALNTLKAQALNGKCPEGKQRLCLSNELKQLCHHWYDISMINGLWSRVTTDTDTDARVVQRLVPYRVRHAIFQILHGRPEGGHFGYERVYHLTSQRYFWIGMSTDIREWLRSCDACQRVKPGPGKGRYPLVQEQAGAALDRCAMDFSGPWPLTKAGNEYILVLQDYFTKWLELWALPDRKASTVAKCLVEFMQRYGTIHKLHSDQGREFESVLISEVCKLWEVEKTRTQPYTPWSDGMVERANRTIHQLLKIHVKDERHVWDLHLGKVMMAYNATAHTVTKYTPYKLMNSRCEDPDLPVDFLFGTSVSYRHPSSCMSTFVEESKSIACRIVQNVGKTLNRQATTQARNYMRAGSKIRVYNQGDLVLIYHPRYANQKLLQPWRGPFRVMKVHMESLMVKILVPPGKAVYVHATRVKPYIQTPIKNAQLLEDKTNQAVGTESLGERVLQHMEVSLAREIFSAKLHNESYLHLPVDLPYGHPHHF